MSKRTFEDGLRISLRELSGSASAGPTPASVLLALHKRSRRRRSATLVVASMLVLAAGVFWIARTSIQPALPPGPPHAAGSHEPGGTPAVAVDAGSVTSTFNTSALLGHMDTIPFEGQLVLRVAGIDEPPATIAAPRWTSKLDIEKIDFAYLPPQDDCLFCVSVPSVQGHQPF